MKRFIMVGILFLFGIGLVGCNDATTTEVEDMVTVSFVTNGGNSTPNLSVEKNTSISMPSVTKEGHTLDGWYISYNNGDTFDEKWLFSTAKVDKNITLYAKWNVNQYTISFAPDDSYDLDNITQDFGTIVNLPVDPVKEGHTFVGWYTNSNLTDEYDFSTMGSQNITLYPKWNLNNYNIVYDLFSEAYKEDQGINLSPNEEIVQVATGMDFAIYLLSGGRILAQGRNGNGQLATGDLVNFFYKPLDVTLNFPLMKNEKIDHVSAGLYAAGAISNNGRVFIWGDNAFGQIGDGTREDKYLPVEITVNFNLDNEEQIIDLIIGPYNSAAVSNNGRVFIWGDNRLNQIIAGTPEIITSPFDITEMFALDNDEKIAKLSLGYVHSIAVTNKGRVLSWGLNNFGQLGDGTSVAKLSPVDITNLFGLNSLETIVDIDAGENISAARSSNGRIFVWGSNQYSVLAKEGYSYSNIPLDLASVIDLDPSESIIDLEIGLSHAVVLTSKGNVFTWGRNQNYQLGDFFGYFVHQNPMDITGKLDLPDGEYIIETNADFNNSIFYTNQGNIYFAGEFASNGFIQNNYYPRKLTINGSYQFLIQNFNYNQSLSLPTPTKTGYDFVGWYLDLDCSIIFDASSMPAEDVVLYGKWVIGTLDDLDNDYFITGNFNGWDTITEDEMETITIDDSRIISIMDKLDGVKYLYIEEIELPGTDAGWSMYYIVDESNLEFNGNLSIKIIKTAENNPSTREYWLPSPESGVVINLTPDTLFLPEYVDTPSNVVVDDSITYTSGVWTDNPVAYESGIYYVVFVEYEDGSLAMGLIQKTGV